MIFENRVQDQALIGNNWTWYDQWFATEGCTGEATAGFGPFDDGDGSDYEAANRNFFTVPEGTGDYYRAGLEVPAWDGALLTCCGFTATSTISMRLVSAP